MSPTRRTAVQLQADAVRQATRQDALSQAFADELEQVLVLLNRRLRTLIRQFRQDDGRLVRTQVAIGQAIAVRDALRQALRASGFDTLVAAAMDRPLDRLAADILGSSAVATHAAAATTGTRVALEGFKTVRLAQLLGFGEDVAATLWRTILDGVLGVRPVLDLLDDLEDALDVSRAGARRIYDTAISTFSRHVDQVGTTGEPDELFLYAGPADVKTRPFCRERVGRVFTRDEIDTWDNGQLGNPMVTCGGHNCRHVNKAVSPLDAELIALHIAGGRLPHVAAQLAQPGRGEARA